MTRDNIPQYLHLDRRADEIAAKPGDDDDLLDTKQLAAWFGVSEQWVHVGRHKGYGPPFQRMTPHMVRYSRRAVREWLRERTCISTAAYSDATLTAEHKAKISAAYQARQAGG